MTFYIFETLKEHKGPIISESGIKNETDAKYIYEKTGIKNFLIGESLLKSDNPQELLKINREIDETRDIKEDVFLKAKKIKFLEKFL